MAKIAEETEAAERYEKMRLEEEEVDNAGRTSRPTSESSSKELNLGCKLN